MDTPVLSDDVSKNVLIFHINFCFNGHPSKPLSDDVSKNSLIFHINFYFNGLKVLHPSDPI